jgi:hypothetical protein
MMKIFGLHAILIISILLLSSAAVQGKEGCLLRIDGPGGWTKQLEVSQGSTVYLVVLPGKAGDATFLDQYYDGSTHSYSYYLQGYDRLPLHADTPGRHAITYTIDSSKSNSVIIDVTPAPMRPPVQRVAVPSPCPEPQPSIQVQPVIIPTRAEPISLSRGAFVPPARLLYYPIGAHIMNYQNGIVVPKYASQYYFGRDFSLGTIDGNYPGTPFILQYLSDP